MKKTISLFMALLMLFTLSFSTFAVTDTPKASVTLIEYFEDGSYIIEEVFEESRLSRDLNYKSGTKNSNYYNEDGELQWTATLKGDFTYTGTTATCVSSSISFTAHVSSWKCTDYSATKSGTQARGEVTVKKYFLGIPNATVENTIILKCSATGVLS